MAIVYSLNDMNMTTEQLCFTKFDDVATAEYNECFYLPKMCFSTKNNDIISHIDIGIKNLNKAIYSITLGPKCVATANDIKQVLVQCGILENYKDNSIFINKSASTYR